MNVESRSERYFIEQQDRVYRNTDGLFWRLLLIQWIVAVWVAIWISPLAWKGIHSSIHPHLWAAIFLGGLVTALPVMMAIKAPGQTLTRHSVAIGQMLLGSLLIHLSGGHIETHFHVFVSLAFLAFYRDWKVLITASAVVCVDHILRGLFWPQSIFGVTSPLWRALEHIGWVVFEVVVLYFSIQRSLDEMRKVARSQAELELINMEIEAQVERRTRQLAQSEERFRLLSDAAPIGIMLTDADGRYVYVNERWREITGMTPSRTVAANILHRYHEDDRERVEQAWKDGITARRRFEYDGRLLGDDGGIACWVHVRVNVMTTASGEVHGCVGTVEDVTEREIAARKLAKARDDALESARLKSEFLANMSHEIRTPLNAVMGMTSMLMDTSLDTQQREFAHTAYGSAESLLTLLNDILDFSKMEAGKLTFEAEEFDLRETIEETLDLVADQAHSKNLELVGFLEPGVRSELRGDAGRLRQVLLNLVGNAVKFTAYGEVVVRAFEIEDLGEHAMYRFEIRDTGIGIEKEAQAGLFEAFTQADGSTTRKYGGTGLGLAICKHIVEMMGGSIGLDSETGKGTTFWFTAKFHRGKPGEMLVKSLALEKLKSLRVLVVDDNVTNALVLHHQLGPLEIDDHHVSGAKEALALLRTDAAAGKPFQLVISDMQMPGMDGLALAREIHTDTLLKGTPFIVLTSLGARLTAADMQSGNISECLLKPIKGKRLVAAIARVMNLEYQSPVRSRIKEAPVKLSHLRILVAEDNITNQKVISMQLKRLGFAAEIAANGFEVIRAVERTSYDIIFMDCQMPEMDGYEATRRIRALESDEGNRSWIVALTANAMPDDREHCLSVGMDDYLSKPVRPEDLQAAIQHRLTVGTRK
jgi:PAS domain S-box-containing protein